MRLYADAQRSGASGTESRLPDDTPDMLGSSSSEGQAYSDVGGSTKGVVEPPPSLASQQGQFAGVANSGGDYGRAAGADTNIYAQDYPPQAGGYDGLSNNGKESGGRRADYRSGDGGK
jgi:hypothetical protein